MNREEIRAWVESNSTMMPETHFTPDDLNHIAMCMEHLYEWAFGRWPDLGHFLTAVANNDFRLACTKADIPNRKALYLYALFMYNKLPADYMKGGEHRAIQSAKTSNHQA